MEVEILVALEASEVLSSAVLLLGSVSREGGSWGNVFLHLRWQRQFKQWRPARAHSQLVRFLFLLMMQVENLLQEQQGFVASSTPTNLESVVDAEEGCV